MKRVLISSKLPLEGFVELQKQFEIVMPEKSMFTKMEVIELLPEFDAFLPTFQFKVDKEVLDAAAKRVKIIANYGVGYNNIDVNYAAKLGIVVTNSPDPVIEPTAEHALALMLAAARRISECDRKLRIPNEIKLGVMENLGISLCGKTLGIIGMGRIGQSLASKATALGMKIIYTNRNRLPKEKELQAEYYSLDDLLKTADVVSLHVPSTAETHHLLNKEKLKLMKSTAILINTSRGDVIEEKALVKTLKEKQIYAAGLDVFEHKPEITKDFFELDNVILSPHNGTATIDARNEMSRFASQNIIRFFQGRSDITRVN